MPRISSISVKRRVVVDPDAPVRTWRAEIDHGIWTVDDEGIPIIATAPGVTLTVVPGTYDDTDGPTAVIGQWWDYGRDIPLGNPGDTTLLVTPAMLDDGEIYTWIGYRETAYREGLSAVYEYELQTVRVLPAAMSPPVWANASPDISPLVEAGAPIAKPVYQWWDPTFLGMTIEGQWFKNGVPTGLSGPTYSDTADGDKVVWGERATINETLEQSAWEPAFILEAADPSAYGIGCALVSNKLFSTRASIINGVVSRIDGLPGGGVNMEVYSSYNHTTRQYVRNPNLWANDILWEMSSFYTRRYFGPDDPYGRAGQQTDTAYGVNLVAPRIAIGCGHAYTPVGDYLTWTTTDNRTVQARVIGVSPGWHTSGYPSRAHLDSKHYNDTAIYVLDRDVAVQGVAIMPILGTTAGEALRLRMTIAGAGIPVIGYSRAWRPSDNPVYADYNFQHQQLLWIKDSQDNMGTYNGPYEAYNYNVQSGDSGHATVVLINDEPYMIGALTYAQLGDTPSGTYNISPPVQGVWTSYEAIANDLLLVEAMNDAITRGLLDAPLDMKVHVSYGWTPTLIQLADDTILTLDDDTPLTLLPI